MGDRKELNKYIPPDFDPKHLSKVRIKKQSKVQIRFMLPCGVQCSTCGEFMGAGKKFNAKKEQAGSYLNIKRFRFFWKCNVCSTELVMSTDPKNQDYKLERGGTRLFELHKAKDKEKEDSAAEALRKEETDDAMTAMEAKAEASRREMDSLAALETMLNNGERHRGLGPEQILQRMKQQDATNVQDTSIKEVQLLQAQEDEDMAAAQQAFRDQNVRRIPDVAPNDWSTSSSSSSSSSSYTSSTSAGSTSSSSTSSSGGILQKRPRETTGKKVPPPPVILKRRKKNDTSTTSVVAPPPPPSSALGVTMYKSSSDEED